MRSDRNLTAIPCVLVLVVGGIVGVAALRGAALGAPAQRKQTSAKPSVMPNFQEIARKIVEDSAQVKEKEAVVISGDPTKIPLMEAIAIEVAKKGGFPHLVLDSQEVQKRVLTEAPTQYLDIPNPMAIAEIKRCNVMIQLSANENPANLAQVPEERVALARKATQAITDTIYAQPMRTVELGNPFMPTASVARFYNVPLSELETHFWEAVNTPHATIEENTSKIKQALAPGREIRIRTQAGTDLRLKLSAGRDILISDGQIHRQPSGKPEQVWLPAGEVYTAPDAASVNGTAVVPFAEYRGIKIRNLRLTFVNGKVTHIEAAQNAEALQQALAQSSGDRDAFAYVDIGVNPNSQPLTNPDYCTFEMAGMVTIGIGQAPWAGSPNQSEFAQEFFLPRATLDVDGQPIVKEGKLSI